MKQVLILCAGVCIAFASCQSSEKTEKAKEKNADKSRQKVIAPITASKKNEAKLITGTYAIIAGKGEDTARSSITYAFYEDNGSLNVWQKAINDHVKKGLYRPEGKPIPPEPLTVKLIEKSMNDFKRYANRNKNEFEMTYSSTDEYEIDTNHTDFVTLKSFTSYYDGGAHGMYGTGYTHFDKRTGKELNLSDFITDLRAFNRIAEKYFRKSRGLSPTEKFSDKDYSFADDQFACNDNFHFDEKNISFHYMPYEISTYAEGVIDFSIPLKKMEHLLKLH